MFMEGTEEVESAEQPGCPVTVKTDGNMVKMRTFVRNDCQLYIRMVAEELSMDKGTVR
jgi:hypothetical protein